MSHVVLDQWLGEDPLPNGSVDDHYHGPSTSPWAVEASVGRMMALVALETSHEPHNKLRSPSRPVKGSVECSMAQLWAGDLPTFAPFLAISIPRCYSVEALS
ncbi:hypothetical protein H5410_027963 [Solanum commersonii]|uniref:Uncharacterized protein n=1 Tax=Solanum commersonii TaxID=4109 RepID=A0A9J5Z3L6_SOLCO|nr:hypothetical protein H5410_027963 [Solanum commersonii]